MHPEGIKTEEKLYYKLKLKWYERLWYWITRNKIGKWQELKGATEINVDAERWD